MVTSITVDGTSVDLNTISADVSITVGRRDLDSTFAPSACRITFYDVVATTYTALVGKKLAVNGYSRRLFGGYITDVRLTVATSTSGARCDIIAAGPSSRLGLITTGTSGYAGQTVSARCSAIASEVTTQDATFVFANELGTDEGSYTLSSAVATTTTATSALQAVLEQIGGVLYDNPAHASSTTGMVSYYANDCTSIGSVTAAPTQIAFAPTFEQSGQIINDVVVTYDTGTINRSNATSQTLYGKRTRNVTTKIDNATNATDLADEIIARVRRPRWAISDVTLIQTPLAAEIGYDRIGGSLTITSLPTGSPSSTYTGIVQGWDHKISDGTHRTTFYLADPADVGLAIAWNQIPSTSVYRWNTIKTAVIWDNALTLADLTA